MNYPTHLSISPLQEHVTIAQLSDLHLSEHEPKNLNKFLAVLDLALSYKPDLLLLTGDLVNDGITSLYDWLFDALSKTNIPFVCLAGNHDVTREVGHDLPFENRQFLPVQADSRLIDTHHRLIIEMSGTTWQLLAVNSAVHGQIHGDLDIETLHFLTHHLKGNLPTLIAMHHHPISIGSAWIDAHKLMNADVFWQILHAHSTLYAHVVCGHVHQATVIEQKQATLYTCPATSRQFLPHQDDFGIDEVASGFRLLQLYNNSTLDTWVKRLDNNAL